MGTAKFDSPILCGTSQVSSSTHPGYSIVVSSQEEYDRLRQLVFSQNNLSATYASASGMHAYTVSPQKLWILDSGASSHMTVIKQKFVFLKWYPVTSIRQ